MGLYDYGSRWYDAAQGRFIQPDSIIPDPYNPLSYDRYAYAWNSPTNYNDPTGHAAEAGVGVVIEDDEDFYEAYAWQADKTDPEKYHGHLKEYFLVKAAYYYSRMEGDPAAIEANSIHLDNAKNSLLINGYNGTNTAVSNVFDTSGLELLGGVTSIAAIPFSTHSGQIKFIHGYKVRVDWENPGKGVHVTVDGKKYYVGNPPDLT